MMLSMRLLIRRLRVNDFATAMAVQKRGGLTHADDCPTLGMSGHACMCGAVQDELERLKRESPGRVPWKYLPR